MGIILLEDNQTHLAEESGDLLLNETGASLEPIPPARSTSWRVRFPPALRRVDRARQLQRIPAQLNPPYPFAAIRQPRVQRGLGHHAPGKVRIAETTTPQRNPPYPHATIHQPRVPRGLRSRKAQPVEVTLAQPAVSLTRAQPRPARGLGHHAPGKVRINETVPPQFNPPFPFVELMRRRDLRSLLRRGKQAQPVAPQFNPPFPHALIVQRRSLRSVLRRGRFTLGAPQDAPVVENAQPRRVRGLGLKQGGQIRLAETTTPQRNPPFPFHLVKPTRLARVLARRGKSIELVPLELAPLDPERPARPVRGMRTRVARRTEAPITQATPPVAPYPFSGVGQPRRARGLFARKSKPVETVPPQFNPPFPHALVKPTRSARALARRGKAFTVTPNADGTITENTQPRRARGLFARRARPIETTRPQLNPPYPHALTKPTRTPRALRRARPIEVTPGQLAPVIAIVQSKRRGLPTRRAKAIETTRPQLNPPFPFSLIKPTRVARALRRGKVFSPTPSADGAITENAQPRRARGLLSRRSKPITTVPPQFNPPYPHAVLTQPRRPRGLLSRRGRDANYVQDQQPLVPNPALTWVIAQPRRLRTLMRRAGRSFETVRPQLNPPFPTATVHQPRQLRGLRRRGQHATPTPAQLAPIDDVAQPRRLRALLSRRSKPIIVTPPQSAPVDELTQPRRARGLLSRRSRPATVIPKQVAPPYPHARIAQPRVPRGQAPQRRTRTSFPFPAIIPETVAAALRRPLHALAVNAQRLATVLNPRRDADALNAERKADPRNARNVAEPQNPIRSEQ